MREPKCRYFAQCGGCQYQNLEYNEQLNRKKIFLTNEFLKAGIQLEKEPEIFYGNEYGYRNRMDFVFSKSGPGFRKKGRFDRIVPIQSCEISNKKINQLLEEVWMWFEKYQDQIDVFNLKISEGTLKYAVIRASENVNSSTVSFILNKESKKIEDHLELIKKFSLTTAAQNIIVGYVDKRKDVSVSEDIDIMKGEDIMSEKILQQQIKFSTQSFFQNNTCMTEKMVAYVREIFIKENTKQDILLDLYGGAGTFGLNMIDLFNKIIILDNDNKNISILNSSINEKKINNKMEAVCKDASYINNLPLTSAKKLYMIVDPPRSGIDKKTLDRIRTLGAEILVYVSCNPLQLVKELNFLTREYKILSTAIFDLFPQTPHMEVVLTMKKKEKEA